MKIQVLFGIFALSLLVLAGCNNLPKEPGKTWVKIEPIQCYGNPWEEDWLESNNMNFEAYPKAEEFNVIKEYYQKQEIIVFDVRKSSSGYETICTACSCPRGDVLNLLVVDSDVNKMVDLG